MTKQRDPLGKRALFSGALEERKHGPLDVSIRCSSCGEITELSAVDLVVKHFPLFFWMPGRRPGHLMRCHACNELAWHSVRRQT